MSLLDRADERGRLHGREQVVEEPLLGPLEGRQRGGAGRAVAAAVVAVDAGHLQRLVQVVVDDLERVGVLVVDGALLAGQRVPQHVDLDPVVGQGARLVQAQRLQIAGDHFQGRHAAPLHRRDEVLARGERRQRRRPQPEALGVGQAMHGRRPGGRDVDDARTGQRVLQSEPGEALLRREHVAPRAFLAGGVGHRVGFVEDDDAVVGVADLVGGAAGEPLDDLVEAGLAPLALGGAQRRVGREEHPLGEPDRLALLDAPDRDDVGLTAADGGPVAAGVLDQLVGLRQPQCAPPALQPVPGDDGGHLPALAASGAVAQHPRLAEPYRGLLEVLAGVLLLGVSDRRRTRLAGHVHADAPLPSAADQVPGRQVLLVRLASQRDALELCGRQSALTEDGRRQRRLVLRRRMAHGRHRLRLHERGRVVEGIANADRLRPPGRVRSGVVRLRARLLVVMHRLVLEPLDRTPVVLDERERLRPAGRRGRLGRLAAPARRRLQRQPVRHAFGHELQQVGGGAGARVRVDRRLGLFSAARRLVDHGQAGREARSPGRVHLAAHLGGETDDRLQRFGRGRPGATARRRGCNGRR